MMSYTSVQIVVLVVLSVNSLSGFYILSQFLVGAIKFRVRQPRTQISSQFIVLRNLSAFSMISFIFSQGVYMLCRLFYPHSFAVGWTAWLLRMLTVFSFLIFQFWRLHTTFRDTIHALNKSTIITFTSITRSRSERESVKLIHKIFDTL